MEQKLSNEEIVKIFYTYYGSKYEYSNEYGSFKFKVSFANIHIARHISEGAKLGLKPLSAISDEHAIGIANMLFPLINLGEDAAKIYYGRTAIHFHLCNYSWDNEDVHDNGKSRIDISERIRPQLWIDAFDQLREWGYALPYKGKSLFDWGIAYDITKQ